MLALRKNRTASYWVLIALIVATFAYIAATFALFKSLAFSLNVFTIPWLVGLVFYLHKQRQTWLGFDLEGIYSRELGRFIPWQDIGSAEISDNTILLKTKADEEERANHEALDLSVLKLAQIERESLCKKFSEHAIPYVISRSQSLETPIHETLFTVSASGELLMASSLSGFHDKKLIINQPITPVL